MSPNMIHTVTVLGLGKMGAALCKCLMNTSVKVHMWNRTRERQGIQELISQGAVFEPTASEAIQPSGVVIICVLDYATILSMLKDPDTSISLAGKTVVNLTNSTPRDAREMNKSMHDIGVSLYFDGGIMVTPQLLGTKHSFVFYSGESKDPFEPLEKLLGSFGGVDYLGADPGAASLHDLALLAGMYGMFSGGMTAVSMLRKHRTSHTHDIKDGDTMKVSPVVSSKLIPMLQALLPSIVSIAERVDAKDYGAHGHPNSMQHAALQNILQTCVDEGVLGGSSLQYIASALGATVRDGGGGGGLALVAERF